MSTTDKTAPSLTATRLRELLDYDHETGIFRWKTNRGGVCERAVAGSLRKNGYIMIRIDYRNYRSHRLAWLYMHGHWPIGEIDHINGITKDNRIINLREATHSQNLYNRALQSNNKSKMKGVSKSGGRWRATICINKRKIHIGCFLTPEQAHAAYCKEAIKIAGEFANFGAGAEDAT